MSFDLRAWQKHAEEVLNTPIPAELIQQREQSGQTLNYINSATAVAILNRAFGVGGWEFVKIASGVRETMEDKYKKKGHTMVYEGELRVFIPDAITGAIRRDNYASFPGFGTKTMFGGANEDQMADKSAQSDCLKKCASIVGVGSQLYFKKKSMAKALNKFLADLGVEPEPGVWDDIAMVMQFQAEWDYLDELKKQVGATDDDLDDMASNWSDGKYKAVRDIQPKDFKDFVAFMKNMVSNYEEDEEDNAEAEGAAS